MVSSKQSPIVHVGTVRANRLYPRYQRASSFEYTDIVIMLALCFAMYGLFIYFFLPTIAPAGYRRIVVELSYHWQAAWYSMRYTLSQVSLSFSHTPVIGEWYQYLLTLVMA